MAPAGSRHDMHFPRVFAALQTSRKSHHDSMEPCPHKPKSVDLQNLKWRLRLVCRSFACATPRAYHCTVGSLLRHSGVSCGGEGKRILLPTLNLHARTVCRRLCCAAHYPDRVLSSQNHPATHLELARAHRLPQVVLRRGQRRDCCAAARGSDRVT